MMETGVKNIPAGDVVVEGEISTPGEYSSVVFFAHGSGSSRFSSRNNFVAEKLRKNGHATVLFNLLSESEERSEAKPFDLDKLSKRLADVTRWVLEKERGLNVGFFGSSTGATVAISVAIESEIEVKAIVSRGGHTDIILDRLEELNVPVLLIVGGEDHRVKKINERALDILTTDKKLEIVPGAGHLFEGKGELERVADLASDWFGQYLLQ